MRKTLGYILLALSAVAWGTIVTLPFFGVSIKKAAVLATGLVVIGEAAFLLGIALLGREAWEKVKAYLKRRRTAGR